MKFLYVLLREEKTCPSISSLSLKRMHSIFLYMSSDSFILTGGFAIFRNPLINRQIFLTFQQFNNLMA